MAFFNSAINILQMLVIAIGAGLGIWGGINLMEGYGADNPGAKSQGIKTPEAARDKALGLVQAGIHLGAVVATLIISEIVDVAPVTDGWKFVYILEVIIIAIFAVALLFKTMAGGKKEKTA